jgi:hypothetical protein
MDETLPESLEQIFESRFNSTNIFTCAFCGKEMNSIRLTAHTKECLNFFSIYSGNGPIVYSQPVSSHGFKKRKIIEEDTRDEIEFPLDQGYYNNNSKATNFEKGKCNYPECVAKNSGHNIDRSVYIYCKNDFLHYCK